MKITFECTECKNRNYDSFNTCKKHTVHKESK